MRNRQTSLPVRTSNARISPGAAMPGPSPQETADDDRVVPDGRGRRRPIAQRGDLRVELLAEIADTSVAELRVELAVPRVQREQPPVRRAVNDPPLAVGLAVGPVGAAAVDAAGRRLVLERMILEGIELPELLAGRCVEGHDAEISGGDVHHAVDHDRRALDRLARPAFELPACGTSRPA